VIGRDFGYDLIEQVAQRPALELRLELDGLAGAGLVFCRGITPHWSYLFKHALVQDASYSTLLRARRQELQARVAVALERNFERQPELLAHHLTIAGDTERAVDQWLKTGSTPRRARRISKQHAISDAVWWHCPKGRLATGWNKTSLRSWPQMTHGCCTH
jgi:predicted ATPase